MDFNLNESSLLIIKGVRYSRLLRINKHREWLKVNNGMVEQAETTASEMPPPKLTKRFQHCFSVKQVKL